MLLHCNPFDSYPVLNIRYSTPDNPGITQIKNSSFTMFFKATAVTAILYYITAVGATSYTCKTGTTTNNTPLSAARADFCADIAGLTLADGDQEGQGYTMSTNNVHAQFTISGTASSEKTISEGTCNDRFSVITNKCTDPQVGTDRFGGTFYGDNFNFDITLS